MTLLLVNMLFVHVCLCYGIALHEVTTCFVSAFVAIFNTSETLCKLAVYCQKTLIFRKSESKDFILYAYLVKLVIVG